MVISTPDVRNSESTKTKEYWDKQTWQQLPGAPTEKNSLQRSKLQVAKIGECIFKNVEKKNFRSIKKLINKYNQNILFIHLNTKEEIKYGKSILSTKVQNYLKKNKKDYFYCNFNNDLNLFYKNDGHPNQIGYDYLFRCVSDILDKN